MRRRRAYTSPHPHLRRSCPRIGQRLPSLRPTSKIPSRRHRHYQLQHHRKRKESRTATCHRARRIQGPTCGTPHGSRPSCSRSPSSSTTPADPRAIFTDLQEIAEGESGSVYAAHAECVRVGKEGCEGAASLVAIKRVPIPCDGSRKLTDLRGELELARSLRHANVLRMERLYVDVVEESLWIGMELMDRSLADVLGVVGEEAVDDSGPVAVSEKMIARFVWDVLLALSYIRKHHIAHRDVRSDNLLLSRAGVLKLSDFSNAVCSPPGTPKCSDHVGVVYWEAPEIRAGLYDPLKVDVWSLGATTWELAHGDPPFMDVEDTRLIVGHQLPPVREPETLSRSFHDFLHLCSQPVASRPDPDELLNAYFIRTACPRSEIVRLLGQCKAIDEQQLRRQSGDSDS
ncbi:kinase-like domain-containing protein [Lactarius hengduanensis]|nr:kinase-like domain-containing protein [Lactarius hengduanensis]